MQPMTRDVRVCRILRRGTTVKDGYSSEEFTEAHTNIRVYFFPTADTMTRDVSGTAQDVRYKAVINQSVSISLGDRITTDTERFEVVSLLSLTHPTSHQMELRRIWTSI